MKRLLVHFHVYYEDQIPWFLEKLRHINGCEWDLYVTASDLSETARKEILDCFPDARLVRVENAGYDVWPFVSVLQSVDFARYDYVLKLHTKSDSLVKTRWRGINLEGSVWRDRLVEALLESDGRFRENLSLLESDPGAGLLCNEIFLVPSEGPFPEDNEALDEELSRLGLSVSDRHFCAGTMFLGRMEPLRRILQADLTPDRFRGRQDSHGSGSLAHVYERILSFCYTASGLRLVPLHACTRKENLIFWYRAHLDAFVQGLFSLSREKDSGVKVLRLFGLRIPLDHGRKTIPGWKHYLVISADMGRTAPGIVYQALVRSLAASSYVTVLAQGIDASLEGERIRCLRLKGGVENWGTAVKKWRRSGCNPRDIRWSRKVFRRYKRDVCDYQYDAIICMVSNGYYPALNLAQLVVKHLHRKYVIYSVDGMPSPIPWLDGDEELHRQISRGLRKLCAEAYCFVSSNPQMMAYQKTVLPALIPRWDYLFTPYRLIPADFRRREHAGYNILYAGSLYGLRKIDAPLEAFRKFLGQRPDARLLFVGETAPGYREAAQDLQSSGRLAFCDPTERIDDYYSEADCLIDIAADIPDDVFLSSKVVCYLPYDIPILAISGANSPVSQVMKDVPSIAQCRNDAAEILEAMVRLQAVCDYSDRKDLLEAFHPDTICRRFKTILES